MWGQQQPNSQYPLCLGVITVSPKSGMELIYPGIPHTNNDAIFAVSSNSQIYLSGFVMRKYRVSRTDINQGYDGAD